MIKYNLLARLSDDRRYVFGLEVESVRLPVCTDYLELVIPSEEYGALAVEGKVEKVVQSAYLLDSDELRSGGQVFMVVDEKRRIEFNKFAKTVEKMRKR